ACLERALMLPISGCLAEGGSGCGKFLQKFCTGRLRLARPRGARRRRFVLAQQCLVAARGIRIAKIEKKLCVLYRTSVCAENAGGKRRLNPNFRGAPSRFS